MEQVITLSNGTAVTVRELSLEECYQILAPDMTLETFKKLVRNMTTPKDHFEGLDSLIRTGHIDATPSVRFGPAPDFEAEKA